MSRKAKGSNAERELLHMFWKNKWYCVRVAGSGSMVYPSPDILASNGLRRLAIECKATKEQKKYFSEKEINDLVEFSKGFRAEPWIAIKIDKEQWYFMSVEDMNQAKNNNFSISLEDLKRKGLIFDELIEVNSP